MLYLPKSFFGYGFLQQKPKHGPCPLLPILFQPKSNGDSGISPPCFHIFSPCCSLKPQHGSLNVPIEHHPTIRYMVYNGYYKVMSNIPKMGHLPAPVQINKTSKNPGTHADPFGPVDVRRPYRASRPQAETVACWDKNRWGHDGCNRCNQQSTVKHETLIPEDPWCWNIYLH